MLKPVMSWHPQAGKVTRKATRRIGMYHAHFLACQFNKLINSKIVIGICCIHCCFELRASISKVTEKKQQKKKSKAHLGTRSFQPPVFAQRTNSETTHGFDLAKAHMRIRCRWFGRWSRAFRCT